MLKAQQECTHELVSRAEQKHWMEHDQLDVPFLLVSTYSLMRKQQSSVGVMVTNRLCIP